MSTCRDPEGWGPASKLRWDLTPCFEEGIVLSTLLVGLVVAAAFQSYHLRYAERHIRSSSSRRLLYAKTVRFQSRTSFFWVLTDIILVFPGIGLVGEYRQCCPGVSNSHTTTCLVLIGSHRPLCDTLPYFPQSYSHAHIFDNSSPLLAPVHTGHGCLGTYFLGSP
jgi:hypothetical protein